MQLIGTLELIEIQEEDLSGLGQFVSSVFGKPEGDVVEWFGHWWRRNPYWRPDIPRGWALVDDRREILAFTANIPVPYTVNGSEKICAVTGTTSVHPKWRGRGLAKRVGRPFTEQKNVSLLLGVDPSPPALHVWQSLGMTSISLQWPRERNKVFVSYQERLQDVARTAKSQMAHKLMLLLGHGLDKMDARCPGRAASSVCHQQTPISPADDGAIRTCRASRLDIYPYRDTETLNWLYFDSSIRNARTMFVARDSGVFLGFACFKRINQVLFLLECRTVDCDANVSSALIRAARHYWAHKGGSHLLIWPYSPMIEKSVPSPLCTDGGFPPMAYCYRASAEIDTHTWERTPGDGDISLY